MKDEMTEGQSSNCDAKIVHMGEIGLPTFARCVPLLKNDLLLRSMQGFPSDNMGLQRSYLCWAIATWVLFAQQRKRRGLQMNQIMVTTIQ